jgi:hypothetical protein
LERLTDAQRAEIEAAIREGYPKFPAPEADAIQAIRELNNSALNSWVQDLTILCRQLDPDCE